MGAPLPLDGDEREDAATAAGMAAAGVWSLAEQAVLAAVSDAVKAALPKGAATISMLRRLQRRVAAVLAAAEQRTRRVVERVGVRYDYQPVLPPLPDTGQVVADAEASSSTAADASRITGADASPAAGDDVSRAVPASVGRVQRAAADFMPGDIPAAPLRPPAQPPGLPPAPPAPPAPEPEPEPVTPAEGLEPSASIAGDVGGTTAPSIQQQIEAVSARVYRDIPDIYQQAVQQAVESTRGGMPVTSLSLSRIQAAQKALDTLAEHGVTGFTDRAGRNWDLLSYIEMATRTAVSNAYDNLQNSALIRGGHDLVLVYTHSPEGSCPHCLPWLGKILSLTGSTTGNVSITAADGTRFGGRVYATLAEARATGFRHPNCRCSMLPLTDGADLAVTTWYAVPDADSAEVYRASQVQRGLERRVRAAGREHAAAITPQARARAQRRLAAARAASKAHREHTGLRITKVGAARREHPHHAH